MQILINHPEEGGEFFSVAFPTYHLWKAMSGRERPKPAPFFVLTRTAHLPHGFT